MSRPLLSMEDRSFATVTDNMKRIAIIGAGISGLTAGYELKKLGFDVTVYEKEALVGGRMSTRVKDGFHFDIGADHLCNLYLHMKEYCKEFGIEWHRMQFDKYGLIKKHQTIPLAQGVNFFSKLRMTWHALTMKTIDELFDFNLIADHDNENAKHYAQRKLGKEASIYYVDGFTSAYQFHRSDEISIAPFLAIMNSIKRDGPLWNLHRTKGGMIALPQQLANRLNVKTSTTVRSVTGNTVTLESGESETFDAVIMTAPAPIALKLITDPTPETKHVLEQSKFAATISITFKIQKDLAPKRGVTWVPFVESEIVASISNQAMKGDDCTIGDTSLVSIWLHEAAALELMKKSDEEVSRAVRDELVRVTDWLTSASQLELHDLQRWDYAMPKFATGHQKLVRDYLKNHQGKNHLYLCGDYMNALWTEGVLRYGQRLAARIKTDLDSSSATQR